MVIQLSRFCSNRYEGLVSFAGNPYLFLGISTQRIARKHNLSITLLSDPEHILTEAYGAWRLKKFMGKEYMGVARSTFLISPDRIIAYTWPNVKAKGHAQAVLTKLQELATLN